MMISFLQLMLENRQTKQARNLLYRQQTTGTMRGRQIGTTVKESTSQLWCAIISSAFETVTSNQKATNSGASVGVKCRAVSDEKHHSRHLAFAQVLDGSLQELLSHFQRLERHGGNGVWLSNHPNPTDFNNLRRTKRLILGRLFWVDYLIPNEVLAPK